VKRFTNASRRRKKMKHIDIIFDGPPGPECGRFVEVEDGNGKSINAGEWLESLNGFHTLRIPQPLTFMEVLATQQALQAKMGDPTGFGEAGVKENLLHVMVEAVEALREINFKPWKMTTHEVNRYKFATELTDILQFWANAALAFGLTAEELEDALRLKWQINLDRIAAHEVKSADPMVLNKICPQCGGCGGAHDENCPQNFDADALRDGVLKRTAT
jgi:hypothetical protein